MHQWVHKTPFSTLLLFKGWSRIWPYCEKGVRSKFNIASLKVWLVPGELKKHAKDVLDCLVELQYYPPERLFLEICWRKKYATKQRKMLLQRTSDILNPWNRFHGTRFLQIMSLFGPCFLVKYLSGSHFCCWIQAFFSFWRNFLTASFLSGHINDQEVEVVFPPSEICVPSDPLKA